MISNTKIMVPHFHISMQSGSSKVLRGMKRRYNRKMALEGMERLRAAMPGVQFTTDIIVGFPGETDEEFEDTLTLVEQVRYDSMFTFIFSPRRGTPAWDMDDPFTREQKQVRFDRLVEAANRISTEIHASYEGKVLPVLVDGLTESGELSCRTMGGRLVRVEGDESLIGKFVNVEITGSNTWALYGKLVD